MNKLAVMLVGVSVMMSVLDAKRAPTKQQPVSDENFQPTILQTPEKTNLYYDILMFNLASSRGDVERCNGILSRLKQRQQDLIDPSVVNHLVSLGKFDEALKVAEAYLTTYGDHWEVYLRGSFAHDALGNTAKAEHYLQHAAKATKKIWAHEQVAYAQAVFYIQHQEHEKALTEIDNFLTNTTPRGKHALFHFLKATIYLQGTAPRFELALTEFDKALELNPTFDRALKLKALVLEQSGRKMELVPVIRKILELEPQPSLHKRLVSLLFELSRWSEAYAELVKLSEKTPDYFYDLALISWKMGSYDQALNHVDQAITMREQFPRARLLKLEILMSAEKKAQALQHMKDWILQDPQNRALSTLSMMVGTVIQPTEAIALLESIKNVKRLQKEVFAFLGDLYALRGDYAQSIRTYRNFLRTLNNKECALGLKGLYNIGYMMWRQGDIAGAIAQLTKAQQADKSNPLIMTTLAFLYTQQQDAKKIKRAGQLLEQARDADPTHQSLQTAEQVLQVQASAYRHLPFWLRHSPDSRQLLDQSMTLT